MNSRNSASWAGAELPSPYQNPGPAAAMYQADIAALQSKKASRLFFHIGFLGCLILQRFGLVAGTSALFISLPIMMGLLGWVLLTGRASFRTNILFLFLAFLAQVALSLALSLTFPDNRVGISLLSPISILLNYVLFTVKPNERFDSTVGLEIFIFYARVCVIGGILQYLLQFVGVVFFSFLMTMPALKPILVEELFAYNPLLQYGSATLRSNGFFLLEASIFSQLIVLAMCVDYFVLKRVKFLPIYGVAYMLSYSGTGLLSLLAALPLYLVFFYRQSTQLFTLGLIAIAFVGASAIVLPDQFESLSRRSTEISSEGSSGHARYVGQIASLDVVANEPRIIVGFGPGATDRATFWVPGSGGPIQKLLIDYGVIGLLLFFTFFIGSFWRRDMAIVPLLLLSTFILGGGKMFSTPFLVLIVLVCVWSSPPSSPPAPARDGSQ